MQDFYLITSPLNNKIRSRYKDIIRCECRITKNYIILVLATPFHSDEFLRKR